MASVVLLAPQVRLGGDSSGRSRRTLRVQCLSQRRSTSGVGASSSSDDTRLGASPTQLASSRTVRGTVRGIASSSVLSTITYLVASGAYPPRGPTWSTLSRPSPDSPPP